MTEIYFSSDHHFGHLNIIKYCNRPFASVEEMNEALIDYWNETVKPDDHIYYLGDFSLSMKPVREILPKLHGKKYLIAGNHDKCHPYNKKWEKARETYEENGFILLKGIEFYSFPVDIFQLCHFPYSDDTDPRLEEAFKEYLPQDVGMRIWLLHGHVHDKWKVKDKMINVGVDVWDYKPVHLDEINKIILG